MPFGKWKGQPLDEVDDSYLLWVWRSVELREPLRSAVRREVRDRGLIEQPLRIVLGPAEVLLAIELIDRGRRAAALVHHPDVGGNTETMRRLNVIADWIKRELLLMKVGGGG